MTRTLAGMAGFSAFIAKISYRINRSAPTNATTVPRAYGRAMWMIASVIADHLALNRWSRSRSLLGVMESGWLSINAVVAGNSAPTASQVMTMSSRYSRWRFVRCHLQHSRWI
jgi:hypothetical protein